jgi:predicted nucleic acid-binding protein
VTEAVVDADPAVATGKKSASNFLRVDRTNIPAAQPGFRFYVLNHVVNEVIEELRANLGDGEAAPIAASAQLHWIIGMDEEGRAKREAVARVGGQNLDTPGILVQAVRAER